METTKNNLPYATLAIAQLESLAQSNDLEALYHLGLRYLHGKDVQQDPRTSLAYWKRAAEQGHAPSQNNIGFLYGEGIGITKNEKMAFIWYQKAANSGFDVGMVNIGKCYQQGTGTKPNLKAAREFYEKALDLGNAEAEALLEALPKQVSSMKTFLVLAILVGIIPWAMFYMNVLAPHVDHFLGVDRLARIQIGYYVIPVLAPAVFLLWLVLRNGEE